MATVLEATESLGITEAKASLSSIVSGTERSGVSFVIMRYNRPAAMIVPTPKKAPTGLHAKGILFCLCKSVLCMSERQRLEKTAVANHENAS